MPAHENNERYILVRELILSKQVFEVSRGVIFVEIVFLFTSVLFTISCLLKTFIHGIIWFQRFSKFSYVNYLFHRLDLFPSLNKPFFIAHSLENVKCFKWH